MIWDLGRFVVLVLTGFVVMGYGAVARERLAKIRRGVISDDSKVLIYFDAAIIMAALLFAIHVVVSLHSPWRWYGTPLIFVWDVIVLIALFKRRYHLGRLIKQGEANGSV